MNGTRSLVSFGFLLAIGAMAGCQDFSNVEEACHPENKVQGDKWLSESSAGGVPMFARMNCYRRVIGLSRGSGNRFAQAAVDNHAEYRMNPQYADANVLFGANAATEFFREDPNNAIGYTGVSVQQRLDAADYVLFDPANQLVDEFASFDITWPALNYEMITGSQVADAFMRDWEFREIMLTRSWVDGAYTEFELGEEWLNNSGICDFGIIPCTDGRVVEGARIRVFYGLVVQTTPPSERATKPILYPENGQTGVRLFAPSIDVDSFSLKPVNISYPISIFGNVVSPQNFRVTDANWYNIRVIGAELTPEGGEPLPMQARLPGQDRVGIYPSGIFARESAALYLTEPEPLLPSTRYNLAASVETYEGTYNIDIDFTTAAEDQGVGMVGGGTLTTPMTPADDTGA